MLGEKQIIRNATQKDLEEILKIEIECFPPKEAATKESLQMRIKNFPECFWILEVENKIIAFINGVRTYETSICDQMYVSDELQNKNGDYLAIFGVDTHPMKQKSGYATYLMHYVIEQAEQMHMKGIILTCKKKLIPFYESFGFEQKGQSQSVHGGAIWYDMQLLFF